MEFVEAVALSAAANQPVTLPLEVWGLQLFLNSQIIK